MTTIRTALAALALAALSTPLVGSVPAQAADQRDFYLVNSSSDASIVRAWYAHAGTREQWQEMGLSSPVEPRSRRAINFDLRGDRACNFDFRVQFDNKAVQTGTINLCKVTYVEASAD